MRREQMISVLIPTWRRPEALAVCLRALARQATAPARVIIVYKVDDQATIDLLLGTDTAWSSLLLKAVAVPAEGNFLTQLNAGIEATTEPLVALTDDDAEPRTDWLSRIIDHFATDETIVGVGGRDWQKHEMGDRPKVGIVSWFGRVTGNHHLGAGSARDVDLLKGVNWAFRGNELRALRVDSRLRGSGTVMNTEMSVCLPLRRRGWRLVYDPAVAVDHHVAPRTDDAVNSRGWLAAASFANLVHNETLALLDYLLPVGRIAFLIWAFMLGTSAEPGILQLPRLLWRGSPQTWLRWRATVAGRCAGFWTHYKSQKSSQDRCECVRARDNIACDSQVIS